MDKICDSIMEKINKEEIVIKPKVYYILGSVALGTGIGLLFAASAWFANILIYKFRSHNLFQFLKYGKLGYYTFVDNIPWVAILISIALLVAGVMLLKRYDISYKHSFLLIISGILISIILSAFLADSSGMNEKLERHPRMGTLYGSHFIDPDHIIGIVQYTGRNGYLVKTPDGRLHRIMTEKIPQKFFIQFNKDDCVEAMGKLVRDSDIFKAISVRRCPLHYTR